MLANNGVLRYRSPVSGSMHSMVDPFGASAATLQSARKGRARGDADEDALLSCQFAAAANALGACNRNDPLDDPQVNGVARSVSE